MKYEIKSKKLGVIIYTFICYSIYNVDSTFIRFNVQKIGKKLICNGKVNEGNV